MVFKLVICYAREDKEMRDELDRHLTNMKRQQLITTWSDREISPGKEWKKEVDVQLNTADLILLLISSDFMASEHCYSEENPLSIIKELHLMGVITLSCYLAEQDILASQQLYKKEEAYWSDGAKLMFQCASPLHVENYVTKAIFDYLSDHGWSPQEGVRLFAQVNQAQGLENFLEILLRGVANERRA